MSIGFRRGLFGTIAAAGIAGAITWSLRGDAGSINAPAINPPATDAQAAAAATEARPQPRLKVDRYEHNFGVFDVGDEGSHIFTVHNEGDAPLQLELLRTSCKCTLADLKKVAIPPGGKRDVTLEWEALEPTETFGHGARIRTNDPETPEFNLLVMGRVRAKMGIWPELVYVTDVPRGGERTHVATLYSQAFDQVNVTKIESTHPLVTARLTDDPPVPPGERPILFGRTLKIDCRADQKVGSYYGTLRIHYTASGPFAPKVESPLEFEFIVESVGDVSLHGRQVVGRMLNLGTVAATRGAKERVYLHVRNDDGSARPRIEKATPDFLKIRVDEPQRLSATMMRYPVEIEVPVGSPAATFVGSSMGEVRLKTDHPGNPEIKFSVSLIVGQ